MKTTVRRAIGKHLARAGAACVLAVSAAALTASPASDRAWPDTAELASHPA
jgi:hypothetical protein